MELPPRARRILQVDGIQQILNGTTSACAENTCVFSSFAANFRNYLRVRGEYRFLAGAAVPPWELPPRARRIRFFLALHSTVSGTTSACAENTTYRLDTRSHHRNYLRVRGEYHA